MEPPKTLEQLRSLMGSIHHLQNVRCDASKERLEACLEQKYINDWHPIAYASILLNTNEQKYSTIELELLSIV